jgi:stage III sporulation protein AB
MTALGAALVVASSSLIGYYLSIRDDLRIADLREFKRSLAILKSEMEFAVNILPVAFVNISEKTRGVISKFYKTVSDNLTANKGFVITEVWESAAETRLRGCYMYEEDIQQVKQFGKTLGYLDTTLQLRGIAILDDYIDTNIETAIQSSAKNKRMMRSLGVLCGLVIVVVLI